jgi:hypothetical protein
MKQFAAPGSGAGALPVGAADSARRVGELADRAICQRDNGQVAAVG